MALALLWAVKSSKFSLAFPFFLIMMVPLRQKIATYFTAAELNAVSEGFYLAIAQDATISLEPISFMSKGTLSKPNLTLFIYLPYSWTATNRT